MKVRLIGSVPSFFALTRVQAANGVTRPVAALALCFPDLNALAPDKGGLGQMLHSRRVTFLHSENNQL